MSAFLNDVATAALPVAVGLLILTAIAGGVLWTKTDDAWAQRLARDHLEPLSTWCLIALSTYAVARLTSGDGGPLSVVLPLGLAFAAVLLRSIGEAEEPDETEPEEQPTAAAPAPPPPGNLWARPAGEVAARRVR